METIGYCKLKEETLDRAVRRTRFGRGCRPVVRQTAGWWWWWWCTSSFDGRIEKFYLGPMSRGHRKYASFVCNLAVLSLRPWRRIQFVSSKRWYPYISTRCHDQHDIFELFYWSRTELAVDWCGTAHVFITFREPEVWAVSTGTLCVCVCMCVCVKCCVLCDEAYLQSVGCSCWPNAQIAPTSSFRARRAVSLVRSCATLRVVSALMMDEHWLCIQALKCS
jgi:hypothetical protein